MSALQKRRTAVFAAIAIALGSVLALACLELTLRLLPVRESLETQLVDDSHPYLHFKPDNKIVYSSGWNFTNVNTVRINNYGFVNDQPYDPDTKTPLLAVIGDSYVEALMVPYRDTLHGRLAQLVGPHGRVYSFGASGSPLSQYLAYAQFARDHFRPNGLVIVIVGNDFDESLLEYKSSPGFHYFEQTSSGKYVLKLIPFEPPALHRLLRLSALVRYLNFNVGISGIMNRPRSHSYVGNVPADADARKHKLSMSAVLAFMEQLPALSGLAPNNIVFVVDGARPHLYDDVSLKEAGGSYFSTMRAFFLTAARQHGYRVVDMQPRFIQRYARERKRFEWDFDAHWNSLGHEEAANGVVESGILHGVFPDLTLPRPVHHLPGR